MRRWTWQTLALVGLAALTVVLATGWLRPAATSTAPAPPTTIVGFGHVDSDPSPIEVYAARPGRIVSIAVAEGQTVAANELLFDIDDRAARLRAEEATAAWTLAGVRSREAVQEAERHRAKLDQQETVVRLHQEQVKGAERELERTRDLIRGNVGSSGQLRALEDAVAQRRESLKLEEQRLRELRAINAQLTVEAAKAAEAMASAQKSQAVLARDECHARAPMNAQVLRVMASAGDWAAPRPDRPVVVLAPAGKRIVRAELLPEYSGRVAVGDSATIAPDPPWADDVAWTGRVVSLSEWVARRRSILFEPAELNDARTLECKIESLDARLLPRIGQRVLVRITPTGRPPTDSGPRR